MKHVRSVPDGPWCSGEGEQSAPAPARVLVGTGAACPQVENGDVLE